MLYYKIWDSKGTILLLMAFLNSITLDDDQKLNFYGLSL